MLPQRAHGAHEAVCASLYRIIIINNMQSKLDDEDNLGRAEAQATTNVEKHARKLN